nr:hypothetical protein CFP56_18327 [Quercus suber]
MPSKMVDLGEATNDEDKSGIEEDISRQEKDKSGHGEGDYGTTKDIGHGISKFKHSEVLGMMKIYLSTVNTNLDRVSNGEGVAVGSVWNGFRMGAPTIDYQGVKLANGRLSWLCASTPNPFRRTVIRVAGVDEDELSKGDGMHGDGDKAGAEPEQNGHKEGDDGSPVGDAITIMKTSNFPAHSNDVPLNMELIHNNLEFSNSENKINEADFSA